MAEATAVASSAPALFYRADAAELKQTRALKLIDFDRSSSTLTIEDEGKQVLEQLPKDRPCNLLFIFGNARSGKSFMMNCLVGKPGVFHVVNSATPCTRGVDISSHVTDHKQLAVFAGEEPSTDNPQIGFVDVEGQGAEDSTYDTMLALPLLLTSKVVLFNHKGAPTVSDMLSKLGVLARAADYVDLDDEEAPDEEDDEEDPVSRSRTESGFGRKRKKRKFGHLHVLFRDFAFDADEDEVYDQLMGMEKVVKKMKKADSVHDSAKAAKERNGIRRMLLDNFASINVWLFKQPGSADALREAKDGLAAEDIDPAFTETVHELLKGATEQLQEPTLFNNRPLTGPRLSQLIAQVTDVLNKGGSINVPSVYRAMERETVHKVAAECLKEFRGMVDGIAQDMPMPESKLIDRVTAAETLMYEFFDNELGECTLEAELKQKKEEMKKEVEKHTELLKRDNTSATVDRMREVVDKEVASLRKQFEQYCQQTMPMSEAKQLEESFNELKATTYESVTDEMGAFPDLPDSELQQYWKTQEVQLKEYLTLKIIKNDSMLKDQRITELQAEAIATQKKLITQNKKLEEFLDEEKAHTKSMESKLAAMEQSIQHKEEKQRELEELERKLQAEKEAMATELQEMKKRKKGLCSIL